MCTLKETEAFLGENIRFIKQLKIQNREFSSTLHPSFSNVHVLHTAYIKTKKKSTLLLAKLQTLFRFIDFFFLQYNPFSVLGSSPVYHIEFSCNLSSVFCGL